MDNVDVQYKTSKQDKGNHGRRLWVIHDEEVPEGPNSAEAVARGLAVSDRRASINVCIDSNSVAGMVDWDDTAWHAAHSPTNYCSIGAEHDGYAHQTRAEWLDEVNGQKTLDRSAKLFADVGVKKYHIAITHLTGAALRDCVLRGIGSGYCGHWDVTQAFDIRGGHTDPGEQFPYDWWSLKAYVYSNPNPAPLPPKQEDDSMVFLRHKDGHREQWWIDNGKVMSRWEGPPEQWHEGVLFDDKHFTHVGGRINEGDGLVNLTLVSDNSRELAWFDTKWHRGPG